MMKQPSRRTARTVTESVLRSIGVSAPVASGIAALGTADPAETAKPKLTRREVSERELFDADRVFARVAKLLDGVLVVDAAIESVVSYVRPGDNGGFGRLHVFVLPDRVRFLIHTSIESVKEVRLVDGDVEVLLPKAVAWARGILDDYAAFKTAADAKTARWKDVLPQAAVFVSATRVDLSIAGEAADILLRKLETQKKAGA